jgi:hypothetical protein
LELTELSCELVAIEGSIAGQPKDLHVLRARASELGLWTLGPALGPTISRTNFVVAATNRGAVLAWQAGPPGAEDIYFATLANE